MNAAVSFWADALRQELRFSIRSLRRAPGFSAAVILTFLLCIGANTTVFSVLYGLILKPLPFHDAGQLVEVYQSLPKLDQPKRRMSVAQYADYKANADLFEGFALWTVWTFNIGEDSDPERGVGARVTADYFRLVGVQPLLGRFFTLEESTPGKDNVVVLPQSYWEKKFFADPTVIGRVIRLGGVSFTIVGVAPRMLEELNADAILLKPYEFSIQQTTPNTRLAQNGTLYARVKPGVAHGVALAQLATIEQRFQQTAPAGMRDFLERGGFRLGLGQVRVEQTKSIHAALWILQAGALFVLLLGCANVANLMLARANARQAELSIRQALGAGRAALARQMLLEGLLLTGTGAALGCGGCWAALRLVNRYTASAVREAQSVRLNAAVLVATAIGAIAVATLVAVLPVLRAWRANVLGGLQSGSRGASAGGSARAASKVLITGQVAVALVLLVGGGLLLRSFGKVMAVDPGFDPQHVIQGRVVFGGPSSTPAELHSTAELILARMREIPGVEKVGATSSFAVYNSFPISALPLRRAPPASPDLAPRASIIWATPEYFDAMGMRLLQGRLFDDSDLRPDSRPVLVVDQHFAERNFPNRSPIGETLLTGANTPPEKAPIIIGVVTNAKLTGPEDRSGVPFVFMPLRLGTAFSIVLRTHQPSAQLIAAMRTKLRSVDPSAPLYGVGTLREGLDWLLTNRRGVMWLLGAFAIIALLLSAVGIYGMLAYDVSQRTREIGVRAAIGASQRQIVALIFRQAMGMTGTGMIVGLLLAGYLSRFMSSLLFDVKPWDLVAYVTVATALLLVNLLSSWLPARRAARIDPMVALRAE